MSKNFIEKKYNSIALDEASRQQKQLQYFTTSEVQKDIRSDYFEKFVDRKYYNNDVFLNYVKQVLKTKNFLSFAKYFRNPNPSASLVNTRIKEPLSRVFFSEDAYFYYQINGQKIEQPYELQDDFDQRLFNALIFNHNDIIVHDLSNENKPYREFVPIDRVVSIKTKGKYIKQIAYSACMEINDEKVYGYAYIDDEKFAFYNKDLELVNEQIHDFELCPATFVVDDRFYAEGSDIDPDGIVKMSIFSHVREDLEHYTFLKVLQKITDTNGAFPVYVKIKSNELTEEGQDFDDVANAPMSSDQLGGQVSLEARATAGVKNKGSIMQAGTEITVPPIIKNDGAVDMELAKNFITFYHAPESILKYIDTRIKDLENEIIIKTIGDYSERNDVSMTEMQARKGYVSREDVLRWVSSAMSFSRHNSDKMMLSLAYGKDRIMCNIFYGSDFFMESPDKLYDMFQKSPNAIERKNILTRLSQRRNMFNKEKQKREYILYKILPYASDIDFDKAISKGIISDAVFELQSRFDYWISQFEAFFGNIVSFWDSIDASESDKLTEINTLILNLINNGRETNNSVTGL